MTEAPAHPLGRVVMLVTGEQLGGAERNAIELATAFRNCGTDVVFVALDGRPGRAREDAEDAGFTWHTQTVAWRPRLVPRIIELGPAMRSLRRLRPDVVVGHTNLPNVVGGLLWRAAGARAFVWTQCDVLGSTRIHPRIFRRALRSAPAVVTTARHAREWLCAEYGTDPSRVHVVYSRVELPGAEADRERWRRRLGAPGTAVIAVMLATLHPGKDHATVLHAWRRLRDELRDNGPETLLAFAGREAGTADTLKALTRQLGLEASVRFLGDTPDVRGLLEAADFAIFASHSECLGRGATEPMSVGLPVVGADVAGIREAVGDACAELLYPPQDVDALARLLGRIVRDADLRARLGIRARELIANRQNAAATTGVLVDLIERLAQTGRPPECVIPADPYSHFP
ncbi:MAG: glycosyltransferase [Gaiella sp.]